MGVKNADGEEARGLHENAREEARELHESKGGGPRTSRKTRAKHVRILELQRPDQSHESIQMSRAVKANVLDHVVTYVCYVQKRACEVKNPCQN